VRNSANVIGQGLDVRGEGGYVVAAPSVHASGAAYGWEASSRPGEVDVAPVPAAWLAAMTTRPKLRVLAGGAGEPIPAGARNETLFRRASSMRAAGFERDAILAAVSAENDSRCTPPVDPAEVKALVESVCRYAPGLSPEYERERLAAEARRAEAEGRLDIERTLIATVLLDAGKNRDALARMFALVSPGDLENPRHATIAEVLRVMDAKGSTIDPATVVDELRVRSRIGAAGGPEYVAQVCSRAPAFDDIEEYAERIAKRAHLRAVKGVVEKARSDLDGQGEPMDLVARAKATIAEMPDGLRGVNDTSMHAHALTAYDRVFAAINARRAGQNRCARWGVETLDGDPSSNDATRSGALGGLFDGKLYLLGGEAGAGKTTLAWQAVIATARGTDVTAGRPVLVISLEMDGPEINCRLAGQMCGISEERIEHGSLSDEEFGRFQRALAELAMLPINIVSDCETVEDVASRVHGMRTRGDLALVVLAPCAGRFSL
jgi:replicative DNA helicase